ncbi:hypothetical protein E3P99_01690 [Wallemia hederae]|uniref:cAMP-independent regulatory protein pac2 n=1 Tax=Wallemia hederae TaxID=1540922 RepID=A0A4T0FND1_9BASI|nr:hypothetical protein E3P99_01690 [Wallemia hederae]
MVTYNGQIVNNHDAVILLKAVEANQLQLYKRRLTSAERLGIMTGDIFIWEECQGMQRWTDGRRWGPSRVQGGFLWYREMESNEHTALIKQTYSLPQPIASTHEPKLHMVCYTNASNTGLRPSEDPSLAQFRQTTEYTTPSVLTSSKAATSKKPEPIKISNGPNATHTHNQSFSPPPTPPHSYSSTSTFTDPFHASAALTPPVSATRADFFEQRRASHPTNTSSNTNANAMQAGAYAATLAGRKAVRRGSSPYPSLVERKSSAKRPNALSLNHTAYVPPPMTSAPAAFTSQQHSQTVPTSFAAQQNAHRPSSSYSNSNSFAQMQSKSQQQQQQQQQAYAQRASLPPIATNPSRNSIASATARLSLCDEDRRQLDSFKLNGYL